MHIHCQSDISILITSNHKNMPETWIQIILDGPETIRNFLDNSGDFKGCLDFVREAKRNGVPVLVSDSISALMSGLDRASLKRALDVSEDEYGHLVSTIDIAPFILINDVLCVGLRPRRVWPYYGRLCLPGGFIHINEERSVDETLARVVANHDLKVNMIEQVETISAANRDPRGKNGWAMTVLYYAVIPPEQYGAMVANGFQFIPVDDLSGHDIGFDHIDLIKRATCRIRQKCCYTNLPVFFMEKLFTMAGLMRAYSAISQKKFNLSSLRRKLDNSGTIVAVRPLEGMRGSPMGLENTCHELVSFEREVV